MSSAENTRRERWLPELIPPVRELAQLMEELPKDPYMAYLAALHGKELPTRVSTISRHLPHGLIQARSTLWKVQQLPYCAPGRKPRHAAGFWATAFSQPESYHSKHSLPSLCSSCHHPRFVCQRSAGAIGALGRA
jgi:hypothetical protein